MEFKRICPNCGKELMYKSETSYKNAIKKKSNSLCRSCASKERQREKKTLCRFIQFTSRYSRGFLLGRVFVSRWELL